MMSSQIINYDDSSNNHNNNNINSNNCDNKTLEVIIYIVHAFLTLSPS